MTVMDAKEAYAIFISSDFWKALSLQCRTAAGFKCNRCGKLDHCQAHHTFYRENWFDTQLSDLECVCAECHQKHHQITKTKPRHSKKKCSPRIQVQPVKHGNFKTWEEVLKARAGHHLNRTQFVILKAQFNRHRHDEKIDKRERKRAEKKAYRIAHKFRPGMYEGISVEQARSQVGKSYRQ